MPYQILTNPKQCSSHDGCLRIYNITSYPYLWSLVFKSGLGNKGAALANTFSSWINASLLILYVRISPSCKKTWTEYSKEVFLGIPTFLRLSIPSPIMLSLEVWSFEMMVLLSGLLPNPKLETSVLAISLNTCAIIYMIPLGLSAAVSTRASNELGAGRPRAAYLAVYVAVFMVVTKGILVGTVMIILCRKIWGYIYSKDEHVVKYVGEMFLLTAASQFLDGIQSVPSGTVDGTYSGAFCASIMFSHSNSKNQMGARTKKAIDRVSTATSSTVLELSHLLARLLNHQ
ncbi:hypothetical protein PTKIN_Ptkin11bG0134100 [Pterospermum kingtungense]